MTIIECEYQPNLKEYHVTYTAESWWHRERDRRILSILVPIALVVLFFWLVLK